MSVPRSDQGSSWKDSLIGLMILPEGLKQAFWLELKAYEEKRKVPYITSVEEIGFERGIQQGRRSLILLLEQRVGQLPNDSRDRISQLSLVQLEALAIALRQGAMHLKILWIIGENKVIQFVL